MTEVGVNWYLNRFVKFYFDYQLPYFGDRVLANPLDDRFSRNANMFWIRCQIYY